MYIFRGPNLSIYSKYYIVIEPYTKSVEILQILAY